MFKNSALRENAEDDAPDVVIQYNLEVARVARMYTAWAIDRYIREDLGMPEISEEFPDHLMNDSDESNLDAVNEFSDHVGAMMRNLAVMLDAQSVGLG